MTELARRRRPSWLFVALAVSLVVNAFFIGALATDALRVGYAAKRPLSFELRWLQTRLSAEDFATVEAAVEADRSAAEAHFARLRALRQDLAVMAAAETPDRVSIDAKLAEVRAEQGAMVSGLQTTIVDALLALPLEARKSLAEPLAESAH